jgi:hypothetical protein
VPGARARSLPLLTLALVVALVGGCGGGKSSSSKTTKTTTTATGRTAPQNAGKGTKRPAKQRRLVPNRRRAAIERSVQSFVASVERSDSASVCRLLGRPRGTLEGCAASAGIDLRMFPSSNELSIARVTITGRRASARLSGGQTFTLRRAGRRWLISGLQQ